ncbi:Major facilitator superfamily domain [Trinorchestia longiramus]|nr:Major facilitator superfamily domain [Trinorchestia longiramus]
MSQLTRLSKFGYGVGHVLNDLCSSLWFTYLLIFLNKVERFPNTLAGAVLLIGQVADGISTPFVGTQADRTDDTAFCMKYGRRKTWHLAGTIFVAVAFPFIFMGCLGCGLTEAGYQVLYLAPFVVIFQFGWAAVQISHLALIPSLTSEPHERTELNAIRYAFTVFSNITVYLITWLALGLQSTSAADSVIGPDDAATFKHYAATVLHMSPIDWFKKKQFYLVAVLYMCTRLFCNLSQAYMPIYLQDTLVLSPQSVAYIPLTMYVAGFITTTSIKPINVRFGRKVSYLLGSLLGLSACIWINFGAGPVYSKYMVYPMAALLGAGSSTMLVTSLSITADLIGNNVESGAFVYGAMSFTDKLSNGVAIMIIQYFSPYRCVYCVVCRCAYCVVCRCVVCGEYRCAYCVVCRCVVSTGVLTVLCAVFCGECRCVASTGVLTVLCAGVWRVQVCGEYSPICRHSVPYYRYVLAYVCGGVCVVGALSVLLLVTTIVRRAPRIGGPVSTMGSCDHSDVTAMLDRRLMSLLLHTTLPCPSVTTAKRRSVSATVSRKVLLFTVRLCGSNFFRSKISIFEAVRCRRVL